MVGLRSSASGEGAGYPVVVFGGDHANVPLEADAGRVLARALVEQGFSAIFDAGLMLTDDQIRFTLDFASELLRISGTLPDSVEIDAILVKGAQSPVEILSAVRTLIHQYKLERQRTSA